MLAEILRGIPSIATLLVLGVLAPARCLNFVTRQPGDALPVIIKLGIAVVIFEGAMALRRIAAQTRCAYHPALGQHRAFDYPSHGGCGLYIFIQRDVLLALVFGSLVTVAGPTVVQPLFKGFRSATALATFGLKRYSLSRFGVIAAVLLLDVVVTYSPSVSEALGLLVRAVLAGALTGIGAGWLLRAGLRRISQKRKR